MLSQRNQKIKIALFLHSLYGGGAERVMVNLAKGFVNQGIDVDLVLAKAEGPYLSEVPKEVKVIDLKVSRVLKALPGLIKYLKNEKPTVLISAMKHSNIVSIWAKYLAKVQTRVIGTVHINLSQEKSNFQKKNFKDRLVLFLTSFFYPLADAIVAVSKSVAEDLIKITGISKDKVKVIYNPVVTPEIFEKSKENADHPWFASEEFPVILSVGRLTKQKDFSNLIRAFAIVRKTIPAKLVILGEGEERPYLESLVKKLGLENEINLPGFSENPFKYMARAKVFVLSSVYEGFGNVIVEAMACSCPVVSTDCFSGPREILAPDSDFSYQTKSIELAKYGILVPPKNPELLAQAILKLLNDENLRKKYIQLGKERAKDFSVEKIVSQYEKLILEILENAKK